MNRLNPILFAVAILLPCLLSSCSDISSEYDAIAGGAVSIRMELTGDEDSHVHDVKIFRFDNGTLQEVLEPLSSVADGTVMFSPEVRRGTIYLVANSSGLEKLDELQPGTVTEDDFNAITAHIDELTWNGLLMTGETLLQPSSPASMTVSMQRSVARIDLHTPEAGVEVLGVKVSGLACTGHVFPQATTVETVGTDGQSFDADYSANPLSNGRYPLLYTPEQKTAEAALVEITARLDGGLHRLYVRLQELTRNRIYTVLVRGNGAKLSASVVYEGWESGGLTGSEPRPSVTVDEEASVLGPGVRFSAARDTVFFPYTGGDWQLALRTKTGATVSIEGSVPGFTVIPTGDAATFKIDGNIRLPGTTEGIVWLYVTESGVQTGKVTLIFDASPIRLDGGLELDGNGICDFGRYVEGELGTIEIPTDKVLAIVTAEDDAWIKADPTIRSGGTKKYRIVGGWRPNDPKADGRVQEARLVITDADDSHREEYVIKRRNWGLPVVKMGETWWTKYNLRGDVRSFSDQITCDEDPAAGQDILEILVNAPSDQLLRMMGDQYQAGYYDGLPLSHDGQDFYHEGMLPSGQNFGLLDPTLMAPDGYQVPGYEEYAWLSANDNQNLGGTGTRTYTNRHGDPLTVTIVERDVDFLGHNYGVISFYVFDNGNSRWALFGLGHQWQNQPGKISRMHLLLATHGNPDQTWVMEGYAAADRPGQNWIKFTPQNHIKTRTIRCIKTPVEYIY